MNSHIIPTYVRQPISFVRGEGSYLYTKDGTAYLALIGRKRRRLCCVKPLAWCKYFFANSGAKANECVLKLAISSASLNLEFK
ncbi:hypothetical protein C0134_05915 [Moraxella catarrhalis]|uniref:Uncharacterized protein n=1 Tax=Moraxella catarrhalis TaxID=480 RepID=A0A3A9KSL1_MORCA|nr:MULTISPECIES: hypothetical protein [Moraxella]ARB67941.1 hypothetical protein A6J52_08455 [Moraxella catarrhalis]AXT95111.1 hypothetical protein SQ00_05400 [Moraxella catarrhalis]AXT97946.1 hypothetical protein SQ02_03485 [Moraxella catarrhalis]AZQ89352.1 hypothetical protein EJK50_1304 [Moraxella catarrhalis]AZQ92409.1 hypothetical protein EJK53_1325 [Moraxella catarrhalis]